MPYNSFCEGITKCACKNVIRSEMCLQPSVPVVPTFSTPAYNLLPYLNVWKEVFLFKIYLTSLIFSARSLFIHCQTAPYNAQPII